MCRHPWKPPGCCHFEAVAGLGRDHHDIRCLCGCRDATTLAMVPPLPWAMQLKIHQKQRSCWLIIGTQTTDLQQADHYNRYDWRFGTWWGSWDTRRGSAMTWSESFAKELPGEHMSKTAKKRQESQGRAWRKHHRKSQVSALTMRRQIQRQAMQGNSGGTPGAKP